MTAPRSARDLLRLGPALDEGFGSAYERYAMDCFLEDLMARMTPRSVLEIPSNGVMGVPGIHSLLFSARGLPPTLAVPTPEVAEEIVRLWDAVGLEAEVVVTDYDRSSFADNSFDLVWNFCSLEHSRDPAALIAEMVRVSSRLVLVQTQNRRNPGLPLHRAQHRRSGEPWDHGDMSLADPDAVSELLEGAGAEILEVGCIDLPPWPDINSQLRPPREGQREDYPPSYQHLRPGVIRRRVDETIEKIRFGRPPRASWTLFC
ncbi:MAG: methyltransferase domain-containing protein, partial [Myxococcota bacterium]|nr:methyltransferase domain-containing protein [Myxococcota bacterium]